jgi:flotillin
MEAGGAYLDLRRLELAPELTAQVASALSNSQFVNFGGGGGSGGGAGTPGALSTGSDDVLRVVQTLMAAQIITGRAPGGEGDSGGIVARRPGGPPSNGPLPGVPTRR